MPLYNKVKILREELNISQSEFAELIGVSRQSVSSIERGNYHPSIVLAIKIARVFNKKVEEVFDYEDD